MNDKTLKKKGPIREWIETIVVALVLALIIRAFIIQVFYIPSGSMEPTLKIRDRIIVNKFIYRFREPERFDIVVFRYPGRKPGEPKRDFIKRVIGLPGEKLVIKEGIIYINGKAIKEVHPMNRDYSNYGPISIPADNYFVMGDNRPNSADSRVWGFVPEENIAGPAFIRIWPLTKLGPIS